MIRLILPIFLWLFVLFLVLGSFLAVSGDSLRTNDWPLSKFLVETSTMKFQKSSVRCVRKVAFFSFYREIASNQYDEQLGCTHAHTHKLTRNLNLSTLSTGAAHEMHTKTLCKEFRRETHRLCAATKYLFSAPATRVKKMCSSSARQRMKSLR